MNNMELKRTYRDKWFFARNLAFAFIGLFILSLLVNFVLLYIIMNQPECVACAEEKPPLVVIVEPQPTLPICSNSTFKSWMPYDALSVRTSNQWKLQQKAITGHHGIREVDGYMLVAMGNFYAKDTIGKRFHITLSTGQELKVMTGDVKDDKHTDEKNCFTKHDNSMIEFIVDMKGLDPAVRYHGDFNFIFPGHIIFIKEVPESASTN